jgi:hypothetical protein
MLKSISRGALAATAAKNCGLRIADCKLKKQQRIGTAFSICKHFAIFNSLLAVLCLAALCRAQDYDWAAPPVVAAQGQDNPSLSDDQIDQLLEPIALYPDPLLAEILPASTYPLQVVQAAQWIQNNNPSDRDIDGQPWEPSVKALVRYPDVLKMMGEHADWLQALGAAFTDQSDDVTASVQRLRQRAMDAQNIPLDTPEQQVVVIDNMIQILPASPDFCYVPDYDPILVYGRHVDRLRFGFTRYPIGLWLNIGFDWGHRRIISGDGWHPGWDRNGNKWRHTEIAVNKPVWTRNGAQPRPVLPPAMRQAPRGGRVSPGPVVNHAAPVIPRVGAMKRPNPAPAAPVIRGSTPRASSVLDQSASETRQAKQRFQQDNPQPIAPHVQPAAPVQRAPSTPPATREPATPPVTRTPPATREPATPPVTRTPPATHEPAAPPVTRTPPATREPAAPRPTVTPAPQRPSPARTLERSAPNPAREPALGNVTSSNEAKSQSDRGHQSMGKH